MVHTRKDSEQQQTARRDAADWSADDTAADRVNYGRVELNAGWPDVDGPLVRGDGMGSR